MWQSWFKTCLYSKNVHILPKLSVDYGCYELINLSNSADMVDWFVLCLASALTDIHVVVEE